MRDAKATARPAILKAQFTEAVLDFIHGLPSIVEVAGKSRHILAAEGSSEVPREFPDPAEVVTKEMPRPPRPCGRVRHHVSKRTQRAGRDIDSRRLRHSTDFVWRCSEDCMGESSRICATRVIRASPDGFGGSRSAAEAVTISRGELGCAGTRGHSEDGCGLSALPSRAAHARGWAKSVLSMMTSALAIGSTSAM